MIITHNIPAMNSYRNLTNNNNAIAGNLEKLSSGYKINRAGDNAAGLAVSEKMRSTITGIDAAENNVADGISLVKTAEGALQETHDMLNRMTELATLSANGTFEETDRAKYQSEVDELLNEIDRIATTTKFNGVALTSGSTDITLQIGASGAETLTVDIQDMSTTGMLTDIANLKVDGATTSNGNEAIAKITKAIETVSVYRAKLGATQNRLEHTAKNLSVMKENLQDAESTMRDTDVAEEMMDYTKNNILVQSSQSMLAQANQQPQGALQLLS